MEPLTDLVGRFGAVAVGIEKDDHVPAEGGGVVGLTVLILHHEVHRRRGGSRGLRNGAGRPGRHRSRGRGSPRRGGLGLEPRRSQKHQPEQAGESDREARQHHGAPGGGLASGGVGG